jgi:HD-GYP domain-containing protein (c-di-GMP phosphodiesterase class II)
MARERCQEVMMENAAGGGLDPELVRVFFECVMGPIVAAAVPHSTATIVTLS